MHGAREPWRPLVEPLLREKPLTRKQLADALGLNGKARAAMNEALTRGVHAKWCTRTQSGGGESVTADVFVRLQAKQYTNGGAGA